MSPEKNEWSARARAVLDANYNGHFTRPAPSLYPHQWNWDTAFIALGLATYDWDRAVADLEHLFRSQWANGMLPHIVFGDDPDAQYFPGPDFWQSVRSPHAPAGLATSGITQPPVHAFVIWKMYEMSPNSAKAEAMLQHFYPKLLALHQYFYTHRDPQEEGLVSIRHPWEPGTDNSPLWDTVMATIEVDLSRLPIYQRKDLQHPTAALHRPTDEDYDRYVYLVDLFRQLDYDDTRINAATPFLVQEPLTNAVLCWSNECLIKMGQLLGEDVSQIIDWNELTVYSMNEKLWNAETAYYQAYDLVADRPIVSAVINGLVPLIAPLADQEQAEQMLATLAGPVFGNQKGYSLCPTYSVEQADVDFARYWRGPIWINTNWLLYEGLLRYDMEAAAARMKEDSIGLIEHYGFYEYYDPRPEVVKEGAYGTHQFSWTAALYLWWIHEK